MVERHRGRTGRGKESSGKISCRKRAGRKKSRGERRRHFLFPDHLQPQAHLSDAVEDVHLENGDAFAAVDADFPPDVVNVGIVYDLLSSL